MCQVWYPRSFYYVGRRGPVELSPAAHERLRWLKAWQRLRQRGFSSQAAAEGPETVLGHTVPLAAALEARSTGRSVPMPPMPSSITCSGRRRLRVKRPIHATRHRT